MRSSLQETRTVRANLCGWDWKPRGPSSAGLRLLKAQEQIWEICMTSVRVEIERFANNLARQYGTGLGHLSVTLPSKLFDYMLFYELNPPSSFRRSECISEVSFHFNAGQVVTVIRDRPYNETLLEPIENPYNTPASTEENTQCQKKNHQSKPGGKKASQATRSCCSSGSSLISLKSWRGILTR